MRFTHRKLGEIITNYCNQNIAKNIIATGDKKKVKKHLAKVKKLLRDIQKDMLEHSCTSIREYERCVYWEDLDCAYINIQNSIWLLENAIK